MAPLLRLALIYDLRPATHQVNEPPDLYAEFESMEHLEELHTALESLGFAVSLVDAHADLIQRLIDLKPSIDLVFNYSVGIHGRSREVRLPALCELLDIPFIGSDPMAHAIGSNKHVLKCLAEHLGIATPRWMCLDPSSPIETPQAAKVIVKPCCEGSSILRAGFAVSELIATDHDGDQRRRLSDGSREEGLQVRESGVEG
jgi:D-alanine-D-alanine ligase-like ATP-grasp enzyme